MGYIETLQGHAKKDVKMQKVFLDLMNKQAGKMERLISDLMSLSRLEIDELKPISSTCSVKEIIEGSLEPEIKEVTVGIAEVKDTFKSPKFGLIAGSIVIEGAVIKNLPIRVLRDNIVIHEGKLDSLRRFKDEASEVKSGTECGIGIENYNDVKVGDKIEVFERTETARKI